MQILFDTADSGDPAKLAETALIDALTKTPSLIAEAGRPTPPTTEETFSIGFRHDLNKVVADDARCILKEVTKRQILTPNANFVAA